MVKDFIGSGIADEGANKNVVNLLRLLTEDPESVVYIPYNYVAAKLDKSKDSRVHFPPKESGRPMRVVTMTSNLKRFNFSVTCLADVKVEFENEEGSKYLKDMKVWRTYSIIKDGVLNVDTLSAKLSADAYGSLVDTGIIYLNDTKITSDFIYDDTAVYTLNLKDLPLISSNWARPNALNFHKMLLDSQRIAETLKQAKKKLKESKTVIEDDAKYGDVYKESVMDYGTKSGKSVNCVTYTILENPDYTPVKYLTEDIKTVATDVNKLTKELDTLRFKCACIKWSIESAESHRRSPYNWSEMYQKRAGTSKYYQDTIVNIDGVDYRLERCEFTETV